MTKYRKLELKYFTLQYPEYIEREKELQPHIKSKLFVTFPRCNGKSLLTEAIENLSMEHVILSEKISFIEHSAKHAGSNVDHILELIKKGGRSFTSSDYAQLNDFYQTLDTMCKKHF